MSDKEKFYVKVKTINTCYVMVELSSKKGKILTKQR